MTGNLGYTQIAAGQNQKEVTANDDFAIFDGAATEKLQVDLTSASATLTTTQFQQHMMFEAINNSIARSITLVAVKRSLFLVRNSGTFVLSIIEGTTTLKLGIGQTALYATDGTANGLSCVAIGGTIDIALSFSGKPKVSQAMLIGINRHCNLPTSLPGSTFYCDTDPAATATFTIKKISGGVTTNIGTVAFSTLGAATVTFSADVALSAGDVLMVTAPSPQDSTLADVAMSFAASLL